MRRRRSWLRKLLGAAVVLVLAVVAVQLFWFDLYHVDTGSMEPTILGRSGRGEWVQVVYDDSAPERFDLVVALRDGKRTPLVKRVVGLPGETVQVLNGDLLIDGARLDASVARPPLVELFDDRVLSVEEMFHMGRGESVWSRDADGWRLDGARVDPGDELGLMFFQPRLHDGFLGPDGEVVGGAYDVNDGAVEFAVRVEARAGVVRAGLTEMGDLFEARLRVEEGVALLTRRSRPDVLEELERTELELPLDRFVRVHFENRDNVLRLEIDGELLLEHAYEAGRFHPLDTARIGENPAQRVKFGGEGAPMVFRDIRVLRDLHWRERGEYGIGAPLRLGPDEYFLLGDGSAHSRDSRDWGPIRRHEILGRPRRIVWPLGRWRRLVPRAEAEALSGS